MKRAARLAFFFGALAVGLVLFRAHPRDVTLVYDLTGAGVDRVQVEIDRGGESVRRAELRLRSGEPHAVHRVRLTDGEYVVRLALTGPDGTRRLERRVSVVESGTIVLPLRDAPAEPRAPSGAP